MTKITRTAVLCLMSALLVMALSACGDSSLDSDASDSALEGKTYAFTSYTVDDEDQTELMTEMYSAMTLTFEADGICIQTITWSDEYAELLGIEEPVEQEGTYEESSDSVTVTFASDEGDTVMEFTIDSDTLSMEEDGCVTMYTAQ